MQQGCCCFVTYEFFICNKVALVMDIPNLHLIVKIYLFFVTRKSLQTVNRILRIFLQIRVACKTLFYRVCLTGPTLEGQPWKMASRAFRK
jgi:hypothetical protein